MSSFAWVLCEASDLFEAARRIRDGGDDRELEWFVMVAWVIWGNQNKIVHGSDPSPLSVVIRFISGYLDLFSKASGDCVLSGQFRSRGGCSLYQRV